MIGNNIEKKNKRSGIRVSGIVWMAIIIAILFVILVVRLFYISVTQHDYYNQMATSQQLSDTVIPAKRGSIYDRNNNVLASSAAVWTVALAPLDIKEDDYDTIADCMYEILDADRAVTLEQCKEQNYYSIVKRKVDQPIVDKIKAYMSEHKASGVYYTEDSKRYYPYGNFAAHVLGFVGTDNQGLAGLESYYDDELSGTDGRIITARNANGGEIYYGNEMEYPARDGNNLVLTIDEYIQQVVESHLATAIVEHNVKERGVCIVMDVNTAEILAMAVKGDFDPNDPFTIYDEAKAAEISEIENDDERSAAIYKAQNAQWRNKAISDTYEPGSVFKSITAATALEVGAATLETTYYCSGSITVADRVMNCATTAHGQLNFSDAVVHSCNTSFVRIGQSIGARDFYRYLYSFGLVDYTDIDLSGEARSQVYGEDMSLVNLASCSYGQSNVYTPIQIVTAFSTVINGGYLVQPHLVKQITDSGGNIIENIEPQVKRQVISNDTSEKMRIILEQVVERGNGGNAYVAGFRIGGKSGTGQKLNTTERVYVGSFCAFAPVDDPQICVYLMLDEPHSSTSIYGGMIAAPVVSSIFADILPYLGVDPSYTEEELAVTSVNTPYILQDSLTTAYSKMQVIGLKYNVVGDGTTVVGQYPPAGYSIPRGSSVYIYTDVETEHISVTVPSVIGLSQSSAQLVLEASGLNIKVDGSQSDDAVAASQSVSEGESVEAGTIISVTFLTTEHD